MNIAQVVCTYFPYEGGMGNSAKNLFKTLSKNNTVFTFTPDYNPKKYKKYKNTFYLRPLLKYGNAALLPQLFYKLLKFDTIILHYPFFGTDIIVWLLKLIFKKKPKLIIHYHMDFINSSFLTKILSLPSVLIRYSLFKKADQITCASLDYIQNSNIKNIYQKYSHKFKEIPFKVDTKKFNIKNEKNNINSNHTILFVGGLDRAHYFKGVDILLESCAKLENKNWNLKIIGNGDLKNYYKKLTKKLKIEKKVFFLDNIKNQDLPKNYQTASILVLPSINKCEAFGIVLLEAMSCGTPVIASRLPGVRKVFVDQQQGLLINPNDSEDLRKKITWILNNSKERKQMGLEARKLVEKKYGLNI